MITRRFIERLYNNNVCNNNGCRILLGTGKKYYANNIPISHKTGTFVYYGNNVQICEECFSQSQNENVQMCNAMYFTPLNQPSEPEPQSLETISKHEWPWLSYIEGIRGPDDGVLGKNFGWDEKGLWFGGGAGSNTPAYPIFTSFTIPERCRTEIAVDFIYDDYESKNFGLCVYVDGVIPEWKWEYPNPTRIAAQYDSNMSGPSLSGIKNTNETEMEMEFDTVYICKFIYDPLTKPNVVMETYMRGKLDEQNNPIPTNETPVLLDKKYINECLPSGNYRVGFTADNDILPPNRTYLQNLSIRIIYDSEKEFLYENSLTNIGEKGLCKETV